MKILSDDSPHACTSCYVHSNFSSTLLFEKLCIISYISAQFRILSTTSQDEVREAPSGPYRNWVCSVWPILELGMFGLVNTQTLVCFDWPIPNLRSVRSGHYPNIGLFRLVHIQSSVCFVWPIPSRGSVRSGPYPIVGLFRLARTQASVCLVWSIPNPRSSCDKLEITNSLMESCLNSSIESEKYTKRYTT